MTLGSTPIATRLLTFMAARRTAATGTWSLASIDVVPTSSIQCAGAAYNPATGLIGVSYGSRDWTDLKFAEGPPAAIAN